MFNWMRHFGTQIGISLNCRYNKLVHVMITRETVGCDILKRRAKSCSNNPRRRRKVQEKKSFRGVRSFFFQQALLADFASEVPVDQ